jgi:hypothetical protein
MQSKQDETVSILPSMTMLNPPYFLAFLEAQETSWANSMQKNCDVKILHKSRQTQANKFRELKAPLKNVSEAAPQAKSLCW